MAREDADTEELLRLAQQGDQAARQRLLVRHREQLRQMVALRMDRRLAARIDPSDVVQEALADAHQALTEYLQRRPLPFYPWLRQFALDRVVDLHRRHVQARKRSVLREERWAAVLPDESALELASRLLAPGTSPSAKVMRAELFERVQNALAQLSPTEREVLVLRHLEQLPIAEAAAVLGVNEGAVKVRHFRALQRLRNLLGNLLTENEA